MGRRKQKPKINEAFAPMTMNMLNSAAYRDLTPSAAKMLPFFVFKERAYVYAGFGSASPAVPQVDRTDCRPSSVAPACLGLDKQVL